MESLHQSVSQLSPHLHNNIERTSHEPEPSQDSPQTTDSKKPRKKRLNHKFTFVVIILTILLALGGAFYFIKRVSSQKIVLPVAFNNSYRPLFPKDYPVNELVMAEGSDSILIYSSQIKEEKVVITQQPIPKELKFNQLEGDSKYNTNFGEATIVNGTEYGISTISLLTPTHWFLLRSTSEPMITKDMQVFLDSLYELR